MHDTKTGEIILWVWYLFSIDLNGRHVPISDVLVSLPSQLEETVITERRDVGIDCWKIPEAVA